jgi:fatty acid desaturase
VCYASLLVASLALSSRLLWDVWVLPSLIGQAFLRYYLLAEHRGCQEGTDMLSNTRTTLTTVLYRKLAWNMPYHAEHHAFPAVPFHLLPELYRRLNGVSVARTRCVPSGEQGYFNVHRHLVSQMHS